MTVAADAAHKDEAPPSDRSTASDTPIETTSSQRARSDEISAETEQDDTSEIARAEDEPETEEEASGDDSEDEGEDEPYLKYDKVTGRLSSIYRNGDSSSALTVAGNKLVVGTDSGNVHVLALPGLQTLRTYKAHSASVLCCSISPPYPSLSSTRNSVEPSVAEHESVEQRKTTNGAPPTASTNSPRPSRQPVPQPKLANSSDNAIHVGTSSLDGIVCIFSLLDPKDVLLRNFARPVNAIALSPEFTYDRTYLTGGKAGQLVVTKGGKAGVKTDANLNTVSAAAGGWLSSIGLASDTGKDTVLHEGEGVISTIKWSRSRKWVAWVNEEGIKIMRSQLRLGSEESEYAWRRIAHAAKPDSRIWEEMAGVWKAKASWFDESHLEPDTTASRASGGNGSRVSDKPSNSVDKLVVGWGDTVWILHVQEKRSKAGQRNAGKLPIGNAEIVHKLHFQDCIVSGISLFTPTSAAILAYRTRDDDDRPISPNANRDKDTPRKGRAHRRTGLAPQLRVVDVRDGNELDVDELPMSRFETLSAQDYSMETLWVPQAAPSTNGQAPKGTLEGLWELSGGNYAQKLLSSGASVLSRSSSGVDGAGRRGSFVGRAGLGPASSRAPTSDQPSAAHQYLTWSGLKLFIQSPYDKILAVKRQAADHLEWLVSQQHYAKAWTLLDEQPGVAVSSTVLEDALSVSSGKTGRQAQGQSLADFLAGGDSASTSSQHDESVSAPSEKRRIGDLWIAQLVAAKRWKHAGEITGKVLSDGRGWDHWIKVFADAGQLDHITPAVPTRLTHPVIPARAYDLILQHYIETAPARACELLDDWEEGLYDAANGVKAVKARLADNEIVEGSEDWRWLLESLARLSLGLADPQEALRCYILTQNAESAFRLVQEEKLADALGDDVAGFVTLKLSKKQLRSANITELDEASSQAVQILAEEAHKGTIYPKSVIVQLQHMGPTYRPFIYFYLRTLWQGVNADKAQQISRRLFNRTTNEGRAMVEDHADLAVETFAEYDRSLLMEFLEASEVYDYNRAAALCEHKHYTQELVLVLSRTGQTKRALWLIIGELGDATQAINFVKQNPDLWDDLLEYGMDKPAFVRGLLAEVGTSVDPVKVVRHIPEGLEIDGLKEGILTLVQSWEVQLEVSRGVDRVLHGEVMANMASLRQGQSQAIRFDVMHDTQADLEIKTVAQSMPEVTTSLPQHHKHIEPRPGHCLGCGNVFHEDGEYSTN